MGDKKYLFGALYRHGPDGASNTEYAFKIEGIYSRDDMELLKLDFVKRYNNLSVKHLNKIHDEVNKHTGKQDILLSKLQEIIDKK